MRFSRTLFSSCLGLCGLALVLLPQTAAAAWPTDPQINLPLCTAASDQIMPVSVTDGMGGAIVAWQDFRNGNDYDIYAQHVLATGALDPAWPVDGCAVCTAADNQMGPSIVPDGLGGAIVVWEDHGAYVNGSPIRIFAQRVQASGAVDPAWPVNGRALCDASNNQHDPRIVPDGLSGAIVAWSDYRSGAKNDIYAQHILANSALDSAWPPAGRAVCTASGDRNDLVMVTDGAGGAVLAWADGRNERPISNGLDLYAGRVLASGALDPDWPVNGLPVSTAPGDQNAADIIADGAGGAIIAWLDNRETMVYLQHVRLGGVVDPDWPADGCVVGSGTAPSIATDGMGGAIVAWAGPPIFAQRVLANGNADAAWPYDRLRLCDSPYSQGLRIVSDDAGGAIVTWKDYRGGAGYVIYAQRARASGVVDAAWPVNGRALCTAPGHHDYPLVVTDGAGGAIAVWQDDRAGNWDIYSQQVRANGQIGGEAWVEVRPSAADPAVRVSNPVTAGEVTVSFAAPAGRTVQVSLFDLAGRLVASRQVAGGSGRQGVSLARSNELASGVYLVRVELDRPVVARVVVIR